MAAEANPTALGGLNRLSPLRQVILLAALAGSVALGVTVALWSQTPNYTLLYGSLTGEDAGEVMEVLQREGIEFKVDEASGAVLVDSAEFHTAKLKLAGEGLPRGAGLGYRMLEEKRSFGTSDFIEKKRYHHALEEELARSVATLSSVKSSRVHLALPAQSAFLRDRKPPSATVIVDLYPGRPVDTGLGEVIAHLVAASVPNLAPGTVQVIDGKGRRLNSPGETDLMGQTTKEFEYTRKLEATFMKRIEAILVPIVGGQGVSAQVTADLDFTRSEQATERYIPNPEAVRSEQVLVESADALVGGIPGALSNTPPLAAQVPEESGGAATGEGEAGGDSVSGRRESTRNYEMDRTLGHTVSPGAVISKLSVAVVVDHKPGAEEDTREPRSAEEMERITALVKEAIGFDEERGDRVNVINAAFALPEVTGEALPPLPIWQQPWVLGVAKQAGGVLLVLLIAFGVLRPVMRNLVNRDLAEREMQVASVEQARLGADGSESPLSGVIPDADVGSIDLNRDDASLDAVRSLVAQDPKRVANVVKNWVEA